MFSNNSQESETLRHNVIANPHILDWLFTQRTESFVKWWLYETLGASWHWYRFEYALQRGSIHCHGLTKLKEDLELCELTKVALKGYLASKTKKKLELAGQVNDVDFDQIKADITEGAAAERNVCQYVDHLVSTCNPCDPEQEWVKSSVHPSKIPYTDII